MKTTMEKLWWFSTFTTYVELNAFSIIREGLYELKSFRQTHIYFHKSRHFSSIAIFHFCMRWALLNHMTNWVPFPFRSLLLLSFRQKREITVSNHLFFRWQSISINFVSAAYVCFFISLSYGMRSNRKFFFPISQVIQHISSKHTSTRAVFTVYCCRSFMPCPTLLNIKIIGDFQSILRMHILNETHRTLNYWYAIDEMLHTFGADILFKMKLCQSHSTIKANFIRLNVGNGLFCLFVCLFLSIQCLEVFFVSFVFLPTDKPQILVNIIEHKKNLRWFSIIEQHLCDLFVRVVTVGRFIQLFWELFGFIFVETNRMARKNR